MPPRSTRPPGRRPAAAGPARAQASAPAQVEALIATLSSGTHQAKSETEAIALCKRLRKEGKYELALRLAKAGQGRSRAFRLEEALAAMGASDISSFERIIKADEVVRRALLPVAQAMVGQAPAADAASPLPAEVLAVAERTAALVRGGPAQSATAALPAALGRAMTAIESLGRLPSAAAVLRARQAMQGLKRPAVEDTWWRELTERQPERILEQAHRPEVQGLARRALGALVRRSPSPESLGGLLARVPRASLDPAWQPVAALLAGFALVMSDPQAAAQALDEAEQRGADRLEVLRGRWLVAHAATKGEPTANQMGEQARALEALAAQACAQPTGLGLGALVWLMAASAWGQIPTTSRAQQALAKARELAPALGQDEDELRTKADLLELRMLADNDAAAALARLDQLLSQRPKLLSAWRLRLELTPEDQHDEVLVRAAQATGDGQLLAQARPALIARGLVRPFEGLPAKTRVGRLAADLAQSVMALGDDPTEEAIGQLLATLDPLTTHLDPEDRFALDVALLDALIEEHKKRDWLTLAPRFAIHVEHQGRSRSLLGVLLVFGFDALFAEVLAMHLDRHRDGNDLLAVLAIAMDMQERGIAQAAFARHKGLLTKAQLTRAASALKGRSKAPLDRAFNTNLVLARVNERLAPEHELDLEMQNPLEELEEAMRSIMGGGPSPSPRQDTLDYMFVVTDIPQPMRPLLRLAYDQLAATQQRQLDSRLMAILDEGPRTGLPKLQELIEELITGQLQRGRR